MEDRIKGGYVLLARSIDDSAISSAAPSVREIWIWLLRQAYFKDETVCGRQFTRGQCFVSYSDIQEGLKWYAGYRKMTYKKHHCENALKWLTKEKMITTTKTARGVVVTICNYDIYQAYENYENYKKQTEDATRILSASDTKDNTIEYSNIKRKNIKKEKDERFEDFWNRYAKKTGRVKAEDIWLKLTEPEKEAALNSVDAYRKNNPDPKFRKDPERWLRDKRFYDELEPVQETSKVPYNPANADKVTRMASSLFKR